ncbi:MAG: phosphate regulon transcriptional regulator PhoB [Gammaproteobacteria bacterium]|nr:phosphate regulon transcriptional regulator PhoB [Gammaproteobacteria bacterium]MBA3731488.1 phosphate regulon transcriptional regulator PhoB [Gammaproteobacteria bacterium]
MNAATILTIEDEAAIREMVSYALRRAGFEAVEAGDADEALVQVAETNPDLILLDWMLPGQSGMDLARRLRRDDRMRDIPIIMLTARVEEDDKILGLEAGADDYITKPFSPRELIARIKALLRRSRPHADDAPVQVGDLTLDPGDHRVSVDDRAIAVGPTEFRLLHYFMTHPDRVYSRGQLLDRVWGRNSFVEERTVDVHILRLRKALTVHGYSRYIQTVRGAGYRFSCRN